MNITEKEKKEFEIDEKKIAVMCEWIIKEDVKEVLSIGMKLLGHLIFPDRDKISDKYTIKITEFLNWIGEMPNPRTQMLMLELSYQMKKEERKNDG